MTIPLLPCKHVLGYVITTLCGPQSNRDFPVHGCTVFRYAISATWDRRCLKFKALILTLNYMRLDGMVHVFKLLVCILPASALAFDQPNYVKGGPRMVHVAHNKCITFASPGIETAKLISSNYTCSPKISQKRKH
jgi:hypothetical protein